MPGVSFERSNVDVFTFLKEVKYLFRTSSPILFTIDNSVIISSESIFNNPVVGFGKILMLFD